MKTTSEECELIGAIIGDGNIHKKHNRYSVGFTGNPITDKEYYKRIKFLIEKIWNKNVNICFRENGIRIRFYSKPIVERLVVDFGLPYNSGKCFTVKIPSCIENDWNLTKNTIRGIADTDGSVFTANKPGSPNYPSIEITTSSKNLAIQIKSILSNNGFRVANIWSYKSKNSREMSYKVPLNGKHNLRKWINEIGFSNPYKLNRALKAV